MARPRGAQYFLEADPECSEFYGNGMPKYALLTTHAHVLVPKRYVQHSVKLDDRGFVLTSLIRMMGLDAPQRQRGSGSAGSGPYARPSAKPSGKVEPEAKPSVKVEPQEEPKTKWVPEPLAMPEPLPMPAQEQEQEQVLSPITPKSRSRSSSPGPPVTEDPYA